MFVETSFEFQPLKNRSILWKLVSQMLPGDVLAIGTMAELHSPDDSLANFLLLLFRKEISLAVANPACFWEATSPHAKCFASTLKGRLNMRDFTKVVAQMKAPRNIQKKLFALLQHRSAAKMTSKHRASKLEKRRRLTDTPIAVPGERMSEYDNYLYAKLWEVRARRYIDRQKKDHTYVWRVMQEEGMLTPELAQRRDEEHRRIWALKWWEVLKDPEFVKRKFESHKTTKVNIRKFTARMKLIEQFKSVDELDRVNSVVSRRTSRDDGDIEISRPVRLQDQIQTAQSGNGIVVDGLVVRTGHVNLADELENVCAPSEGIVVGDRGSGGLTAEEQHS